MSASPQVMQALQAKQGGGAPQGGAPPGAAPMMAPQPPKGDQAGAAVQVLYVQKILEKALSAFGSTDKKGQAILDALKKLGAAFGKEESATEEILPAEIQQANQPLAGPGEAPKPPPPGGAPPGAGGPPPGSPG